MKALPTKQFEDTVLKAPRPVLVDFSATWCGPCKTMEPVLEKLGVEYAGRADVVKVDVDKSEALAAKYGVKAVPTLILFVGGSPVATVSGTASSARLHKLLDKHLEPV